MFTAVLSLFAHVHFNFKMVLLLCEDLRNHAIHKFFRKFARAKTLDGRKAITPQQVGSWGMLK